MPKVFPGLPRAVGVVLVALRPGERSPLVATAISTSMRIISCATKSSLATRHLAERPHAVELTVDDEHCPLGSVS
jgi:hypothetical protein